MILADAVAAMRLVSQLNDADRLSLWIPLRDLFSVYGNTDLDNCSIQGLEECVEIRTPYGARFVVQPDGKAFVLSWLRIADEGACVEMERVRVDLEDWRDRVQVVMDLIDRLTPHGVQI